MIKTNELYFAYATMDMPEDSVSQLTITDQFVEAQLTKYNFATSLLELMMKLVLESSDQKPRDLNVLGLLSMLSQLKSDKGTFINHQKICKSVLDKLLGKLS